MYEPVVRPAGPQLKTLTLVVYGLQALSLLTVITLLVGVIVNYVKLDDVRSTLYESHFRWQIRTFWWSCVWGLLSALTWWIFGLGFLIGGVAFVWFIYRVVRGFLNLNDGKSMPF
ncbi:hypothetical protein LH462_04560 [Laribacter hongkongensis]|uniref:Transmembrane protein n=1 Tax=Laribacter hongkongensis TaxID=168471 RepID=A0ABD4SKT7_9NEIS|nr:hypothetical protein [Laribacter hongkongensis]MCG9024340.1 hypothetical protein [Laribacter hongkongensis]MCG9057423.1 hypothetical protein [Laribacter hongkongensis]MCG9084739.1 hypothetical protein [Laribacter hongkongensis]MCG9099304.1 hypothetical protein [Laribacter hongkongensis]MCG9102997.1 hypothetical protein [Laribacter hongkongensis]